MGGLLGDHSFRFLFQQGEGSIDRRTWLRGIAAILVPLLALTALWVAVSGSAEAPITNNQPQANAGTAFTHIYLVVYALAVLLGAVCYYNLTAKRLIARSKPPALAGLLPLAALLTGATFWMLPRIGDALPGWTGFAMSGVTFGLFLWNIVELGLRDN